MHGLVDYFVKPIDQTKIDTQCGQKLVSFQIPSQQKIHNVFFSNVIFSFGSKSIPTIGAIVA